MRLALAILIAVTQAAGPWLCCCGPDRVVAVAPSVEAASAPVAPAPVPKCRHCCHEPVQAPSPVTPSKPDGKAPHTPEPCPCGGATIAAPVAVKADPVTADVAAALVAVWVAPVDVVAVVSTTPADLNGLRELPVLTTADRLYAHHVLRC